MRSSIFVLMVSFSLGCGARDEGAEVISSARSGSGETILLRDVTEATGITFMHHAGHSASRLLPETMGSGVGIFDGDGDGLPELIFADLGPLDEAGGGVSLWRNLGDLRFEKVSAPAGLASSLHAMGFAIADWDGNGDLDLLITGIDGDELWLGGDGLTFEKASPDQFEPPPVGFSASATFLDADRTGRLDALITRYVDWDRGRDLPCRIDSVRVYCTPESYPVTASRLLIAAGERLRDATAGSEFERKQGKALGLATLDADGDGDVDIALANDTVPNQLFLSRAGGFVEDGLARGFALGTPGVARGGMGIVSGDLDADGLEDLVVSNFAREAVGVFRADAAGQFDDVAPEVGVGLASYMPLAFGAVAVDLDLDGALDLAIANGHIEPTIGSSSAGEESWAQALQVFRNRGDGHFEEIEVGLGERRYVGRGLAAGDLDMDGDVDLVLSQNGGPPAVLRNDSRGGRSLRVSLDGGVENRKGIGAWLELELEGGRRLVRRLTTGGSYLSASEAVVTFGLADDTPRLLRVRWPSGKASQILEFPTAGALVIKEE